eukprot:CAMPEP_0180149416 /NCGR_PEP_ID=MMETSP0986-20121125/20780_1 /TAXON_ID=697907 /ORGANISM="non described non described, Strain CCMP2293" /LENGTH=313 /DNA_ID=CAMNT_0022096035 /DNA_START=87 /DNA_END=1025 /DNA_ORIENTATION=+
MSLSNKDFATIYATAPARESEAPKRTADAKKGGGGDKKRHKPAAGQKWSKGQLVNEKDEDRYRDRATERRLGTAKEYTISEDAAKSLTVEESKYLGGDMEHTHLVKGLDFALLAKMRSEEEVKDTIKEAAMENALEDAAKPTGLTTHTEIGAAVRRLALPADMNQVKGKLELFLPGRTTFVFDLDDDFGDDLPTQVSRSIEDVKNRNKDRRTAVLGKQVMASISTIMSYIRQGSRPAKMKVKKQHKEAAAAVPAAAQTPSGVVPDEDIFDDVGSYDLTMRAGQSDKDKDATNTPKTDTPKKAAAPPPPPGNPP